jgi:two-component system response regulator DegU
VSGLRLIIADDHPLFREGLRRALDLAEGMEVVAEAPDGDACLMEVARHAPDVVLLDISMPGPPGPEVARRIKAEHPEVRVLVLTMHDADEYLLEAVDAGVDGYVLKDVEPAELERAIRCCGRGERYLQQAMAARLMTAVRGNRGPAAAGPRDVLSDREWAVLQLLADGKANREIGLILFISEKTVKNHASNLFRKLGVQDRTQAVVEAVRRGWIRLS